MRIGYLECFSGISGDMLLGALVDAGVQFAVLEQAAAALNIGARIEMHKVVRGGLTGTKVDVVTPDQPQDRDNSLSHDHDHDPGCPIHSAASCGMGGKRRTQPGLCSCRQIVTRSRPPRLFITTRLIVTCPGFSKSFVPHRSPDAVKDRSIRAFQLLGEAEAAIHSIPIERVHFHEVGALDTIVDIVCSAAGAESLAIDRWLASPLNVGSGTVVCQHGTLPVPAPAALALLADAPIYSAGEPMERVTPTGAAILRMLNVHYEPLPPVRIRATGYGAGGHQSQGQPNLLRLLVGETLPDELLPGGEQPNCA